MATYRKQRVSDQLLAFLAEEVRQLRDPRLNLITLTSIDLSNDLKNAHVYWALPPLPEDNAGRPLSETGEASMPQQHELAEPSASRLKAAGKALQGVENLLRRRIAEELDLRYVPTLSFKYDDSSAVGSRIDCLLKKAGF